MIIWVASFPRSGNTFLRIVLNRLYGVRTSTVYEFDGVAIRLGPDVVGFEERPDSYDSMRRSTGAHFVKTHRPRDELVDDVDSSICLIRDGRDALVSWARQGSEAGDHDYHELLSLLVTEPGTRGAGQWGRNVLSWLQPPAPNRVPLRYTELVSEPRASVERVMSILVPELQTRTGARLPRFDELHAMDHQFFRRGVVGSHEDELPEELHRAFWSQPDNAQAMELLGYGALVDGGEPNGAGCG